MKSFSDLNYHGSQPVEYLDIRNPAVNFTLGSATNQTVYVADGETHYMPLGIDITEIIQPDVMNTYYEVDVSGAGGGITVTWNSIPAGCIYSNPSSGVYRIDNIDTIEQWNIVKSPSIDMTLGHSNYGYQAAVKYEPSMTKGWGITVIITVKATLISTTTLTGSPTFYAQNYANWSSDASVFALGGKQYQGDPWTFTIDTALVGDAWVLQIGESSVVGEFNLAGEQTIHYNPSLTLTGEASLANVPVSYYEYWTLPPVSPVPPGWESVLIREWTGGPTVDYSGYGDILSEAAISPFGTYTGQGQISGVVEASVQPKSGISFNGSVATTRSLVSDDGYRGLGVVTSTYPPRLAVGVDYYPDDGVDPRTVRVYNNGSVSSTVYTVSKSVTLPYGRVNSSFGSAVAISADGTYMAVSAMREDVSTFTNTGVVYIYSSSGTAWSETAMITPPTPQTNLFFGSSISLSGDGTYLTICQSSTGVSVSYIGYIYVRSGATWTLQHSVAGDSAQSSGFNNYAELSSDGLTCYFKKASDAVLKVYRRSGTVWTRHDGFNNNVSNIPTDISHDGSMIIQTLTTAVVIYYTNYTNPDDTYMYQVINLPEYPSPSAQYYSLCFFNNSNNIMAMGRILYKAETYSTPPYNFYQTPHNTSRVEDGVTYLDQMTIGNYKITPTHPAILYQKQYDYDSPNSYADGDQMITKVSIVDL